MGVTINPPKTPVTQGSNGVAMATVPNVCKMPGPPAPFVPTPLPNIGRSSLSPKGYTKKVTIEGKKVAIRGASFGSQGDIASKGTGGGLVSQNTHGPTKFVGLGSLDVKFDGKNVQLLGDQMLNNCGPSGTPANSATLVGVVQPPNVPGPIGGTNPLEIKCDGAPHSSDEKFDECEVKELCTKCRDINEQAHKGQLKRRRPAAQEAARRKGDAAAKKYRAEAQKRKLAGETAPAFKDAFTHECQYNKWKNGGADPEFRKPNMLSPDHVHEIQVGGHPTDPKNLRWMSSGANSWIGGQMKEFKGEESKQPHTGVKPDCCGW